MNYQRYLNAHHFYRDVIGFDYLIPDNVVLALETNPTLMQAFIRIANTQHEQAIVDLKNVQFNFKENEEIALKALLEAISLAPKNPDSLYGNPEYAEFKKHTDLLITLANCCLTHHETAHYLYSFAILFIKAGLIEEAVTYLEKSATALPKASAALAIIYTFSEEWEKGLNHAAQAFDKGIEIKRGSLVELCLFTCAYRLGQPSKARFRLNSAEKIESALGYFPGISGDVIYADQGKDVIMLPSDSGYFRKHSVAFACSVDQTSPGCAVHFHIANPIDDDFLVIEELKRNLKHTTIYLTSERVRFEDYMNNLFYLSAVRDVRLYQMVKHNQNRILRFDVDGLMVNDFRNGQYDLKDFVVSTNLSTPVPFWEYVPNGLKSVKHGTFSLRLLEELTILLADNFRHKTHLWFSDQVYISCLADKYKNHPDLSLVPAESHLDALHQDDSFVWMVTHDKDKSKKYNDKKLTFLTACGMERFYA